MFALQEKGEGVEGWEHMKLEEKPEENVQGEGAWLTKLEENNIFVFVRLDLLL